MLNLKNLLKLFRRDDVILAVLRPDMNEAELSAIMPKLSEKLVRFIHDHAIRFYRSIGSHDFGAYPGVWEEFFFLVLFVTECRFKSIYSSGHGDKEIISLRDNLNEFLLKNETKFGPQSFWELYEKRADLYKSRLQPGPSSGAFDKVVSAFSSNIISRLNDWPALVSHHSANAAAAALSELYGDV